MKWLARPMFSGNDAKLKIALLGTLITCLPVVIWSGPTPSIGQMAMIAGAGLLGGLSAWRIARHRETRQSVSGIFALRWIGLIVIGCISFAILAFLSFAFATSYGFEQSGRILRETIAVAIPLVIYNIQDNWPIWGLIAAAVILTALQWSGGRKPQ